MDIFLNSPVGVINREGFVLASNSAELSEEEYAGFLASCSACMEIAECRGYSLCGIGKGSKAEYLIYVRGIDADAKRTCMMLAVSLSNICQFYDEKYDRTTFVKNIISDNTLPLDVRQRARELHIDYEQRRIVFIVKVLQAGDVAALDIFLEMFPQHNHNFVFSMDDSTIVFVTDIEAGTQEAELEALAQTIIDNLNSEAMLNVMVGISTPAETLSELAPSYKEAQVALEVGRVFDGDKYILSYKSLGIGRLIYHLPTRLCELFLHEVLTKKDFDALDEEIITTIYEFFKNDLNVSETARQLYIHRNTLVYRLDKVLKTIGLDLRKFDDAVVFKVAMMVNQYLIANPIKI